LVTRIPYFIEMASNSPDILSFLRLVSGVKKLERTGWVNHGVAKPESVADHMYRAAMIAMIVQDKSIDRDRLIRMALAHDLCESLAGDITPCQKIPHEEKFRLEDAAMKHVKAALGDNPAGKELYQLWLEYEQQETPEAKLMKDIDKFEMVAQALEYEQDQSMTLQTFFDSTEGKFQHPEIARWAAEVFKARKGSGNGGSAQ